MERASVLPGHPRAIAALGVNARAGECLRPPVTLFGSPFITWRGVPLVPCDKLHMAGNKTDILLLRTGEQRRGVVGLFHPGCLARLAQPVSAPDGHRSTGCGFVSGVAVLLGCDIDRDALGALESVEVDLYYDYK